MHRLAMAIATPEEQQRRLMPEHEIARVLTSTRGERAIEVHFEPRPGFTQWKNRPRDRGLPRDQSRRCGGELSDRCSVARKVRRVGFG